MDAHWVFIGVGLGLALALPLAWWWTRRTERRVRRLEERARRAERLAELGTMTSGLAHEIKNPLSTLGLNVQLIQEDLDAILADTRDDRLSRVRRRFDTLRREADRLRETLDDFLRFAGRIKLDLTPGDINATIEELTDFFEPQADAAGVRLHTQLAPHLPKVGLDAALFKQALLNLLLNATQAMLHSRGDGSGNGGAGDLFIRSDAVGRGEAREIEVHVIGCDTLASGVDADWLDLAWGEGSDGGAARLAIILRDIPGALGTMSGILGAKHANIVNLQLVHRDGSFQTFHLDIEVHDVAHLHAIIAALRDADPVSSVERI